MLRPLEVLLEAIAKRDRDPELLFVGDFVNRGPNSAGVIRLLLTLPKARFCRGNHDDVLDQVLHDSNYALHPELSDPVAAFVTFMRYGLDSTLRSYGFDNGELEDMARRPSQARLERIRAAVPEPHKRFIRSLPPVIEEFDLFVAHAMLNPEVPTDSPDLITRLKGNANVRRSIIWGRFSNDQVVARKTWKRTGYFGHTPVEIYPKFMRKNGENVPIQAHQIVLLDTGCAVSIEGRMTAMCAEDGRTIQASREGQLLELR
jgi:diadenosine tetraphosphatase ApaH/serine/threonine PP2A family protein phosphatase